MEQINRGRGLPRLFCVLCLWQCILHLGTSAGAGDPRLLMPHMVAWLHDILLFGLVAATAWAVGLLAPQMRQTMHAFAILPLALIGMAMAIYPQTLREYLSFPVNIFSSDSGSIKLTLLEYLGIERLWPVAATALLAAFAVFVPIRCGSWRRARLALLPVVLLGIVTLPRSPHPLVHSLTQSAMATLENQQRVVPPLQRPSGRVAMPAQTDADNGLAGASSLTADRIFIIVLEGIPSTDFESRFLSADSRFLTRVRGNSTYFANYHATNLDSYTSLIAMLTSQQVPYRCYTDERLYSAVNDAENLTGALRSLDYYTLFTSTCTYHPFVPVRTSWDRIMTRSDLDRQEGWTTVGSNRMEDAVEDRAAISSIVETAAAHPRMLVMHELIYGHTTAWQAKTGIAPLEYYDRYLAELYDALQARGLDQRSLFVVVSDHGDRSQAADADNYRVPLLIAGAGVPQAVDSEFRSHLDLQKIIAASLTGSAFPAGREKMFAVGSTERWVYGELQANGEHLFIDDSSGTVLEAAGSMTPQQVQQEFQHYLDTFGAQYGP